MSEEQDFVLSLSKKKNINIIIIEISSNSALPQKNFAKLCPYIVVNYLITRRETKTEITRVTLFGLNKSHFNQDLRT